MASLVIQLTLTALLSITFYYFYQLIKIVIKLKKINKSVDRFPMEKKQLLRGHSYMFLQKTKDGLSTFLDLVNKYPKAYGLYFINFVKPCVVVHHPETVRTVIKGTNTKPSIFGVYSYGKRWLGDGLVISSGSKWLRNRRLLSPSFHFDALKKYVAVYNHATDILLSKLLELSKNKSSFEIFDMASLTAFDIILQCAFSHDFQAQSKGEGYLYIKTSNQLLQLWLKRHFQPWKHFDFIYWKTKDGKEFSEHCKIMHDLARKLIKERRKLIAEFPDKAKTYLDFLNILLMSKDEDGSGLTDDELKDEINTFILGGYETTASTIAWTLYLLALHQQYQKICQKEIDDLMKGRSDDYITWNDLQHLPYLTMCLKESLRLNGIAFIERELHEDLVIDGKLVSSGTIVMINLFSLHHNPAVWEIASEFDPERFSPERLGKIDNFAFIPFSAGSRNCIGQNFAMDEMKVLLAKTLKKFNFYVKENHTPIKMMSSMIKSKNGIYLKAEERKFT